jgi:putative flippase GtrA
MRVDHETYYSGRTLPNPSIRFRAPTSDSAPDTVASGSMTRTRRLGVRSHDLWRRPGVQRFWRYALGSVIAFVASESAFLVVYGTGSGSPQIATLWAFAAGIPVNYVLNRRWAWKRRGRPGLRDEVLPYAVVVATSIVASAIGTGAVDTWLQTVSLPRLAEVLLVGATFAAINGGLFLAKYVLLDRLVFRARPSPADGERRRDVEPVP